MKMRYLSSLLLLFSTITLYACADDDSGRQRKRTTEDQLLRSRLVLKVLNQSQVDEIKQTGCQTGSSHFFPSPLLSVHGSHHYECSPSVTLGGFNGFIAKIKTHLRNHPIRLDIFSSAQLDHNALAPIAENVIVLGIRGMDRFNSTALVGLGLSNMLGLRFDGSTNVIFTKDSTLGFTKLRALAFYNSTLMILEKDAVESIPTLLGLIFDFRPLPNAEKLDQLRKVHCSSEYAPLRKYIALHPYLIKPKAEGEQWDIGGLKDTRLTLRQVFYPVDCSRADLTQQGNFDSLTDFSVNVP